eukprot:364521-Chlamydomonas_euryale.AAC.11
MTSAPPHAQPTQPQPQHLQMQQQPAGGAAAAAATAAVAAASARPAVAAAASAAATSPPPRPPPLPPSFPEESPLQVSSGVNVGGGRGVFALRPLRAGQLVLVEAPLVPIPRDKPAEVWDGRQGG